MPTLRRPTFRRNQRGLAAWRGRCKRHSAQTRIHDASGRIIALHFLQKPADPQSAAHIFYLHNAQGQRIFKSTAQAHNKDPYNLIPSGNGWNDFWNRFANWWRKILHIQPLPQGLQGTAFVYDEAGNLLGEYSSTEPAQDTEYIWLPTQSGTSLPVALIQGGQTYAIHSDHLGTPRIITNAQTQVVWQWEYSGFGETSPQTTTHAPNGFQFKLRFPGQYADAESGLFYNWHRSYDPNTGRYTQPDPIGLGGGWNRFSYVEGNPLSWTDPKGLEVSWTGSTTNFGATAGFGGQITRFEFVSECKCGKKYKIKGFASFLTVGAGATLKGAGHFLGDASGTNSSTTMVDPYSNCPDPQSAVGPAWTSGINTVVGAGASFLSFLRFGKLRASSLVDGPADGFDVSLTSTFWGQSAITSVEEIPCCSK